MKMATLFIFIFAAFICSCDLPPAMEGKGMVTISLSDSVGGRVAWNGIDTDDLLLTITVSGGPGPEQIREEVTDSETILFILTPGKWDISVKAFYDGELFAESEPLSMDVKPGANVAAVTMKAAPTPYTVTFNSNGGSAVDPQTVNDGGTATRPENPTKDGYGFVNWYDNADLIDLHYDFDTPVTGDITLYAQWSRSTDYYTVTFNSNGGSAVDPQTINDGGTATRPENPTKDGYGFVNWYDNAEFTEPYYDFETPITEPITLYAKWSKDITYYTVTFNLNGGTGTAPATQRVSAGSAITLPAAQRSNYTFGGWYNNANGNGTGYAADSSYTVNASVTLYAKWEAIPVTGVTLNKNALVVNLGETETLTATVAPSNATNKAVTWSSSNPNVVSVVNGAVTGVALGTATVTVTTNDGGHTATCAVTVAGDGTEANPFLIASADQLQKVGSETTQGGWTNDAHYKLTADVTLTGTWTTTIWYFTGTFDGDGKIISNLTRSLFDTIGMEGVVKNLQVDCEIDESSASYVGGIAGSNVGTIENCSVSGTVTGGDDVGGIAGGNTGTISNSRSSAIVTGVNGVGGIAGGNSGSNPNPKIENCLVTGSVTGTGYWVGGIVGKNDNGTINSCHVSATVTGTTAASENIGGIAGWNIGDIENCYTTGNVKGNNNVGGIAGTNGQNGFNGAVRNCYATGDVEGVDVVGGIVGVNVLSVYNSVALMSEIKRSSGTGTDFGRVAGSTNGNPFDSAFPNYALSSMTMPSGHIPHAGGDQIDGADVSSGEYGTQDFWEGTTTPPNNMHWDFDTVWKMVGGLPKLIWEEE